VPRHAHREPHGRRGKRLPRESIAWGDERVSHETGREGIEKKKGSEMQQTMILLARWIVIALVTGVSSAIVVALFNGALEWSITAAPGWIPRAPFVLPLLGAVIAGTLLLRRVPESGGEGIPSYLRSVNAGTGRLSLAATVLKFPATIITLGSHCSGGIVGPLARISAGVGSSITTLLGRILGQHGEEEVRVAAICGVSGAVSAIFHSPLGGGFFAVEILRKESLQYRDLFPSILTGGVAYAASHHLLDQEPIFHASAPAFSMTGALVLSLLLVAVVAGAFSVLFILSFEKVSRAFRRLPFGQPGRSAIAGILISAIWLLHARWALSTSMPFYFAVSGGGAAAAASGSFLQNHVTLFLLIVLIVKIAATSLTVGSGMSGGFTGPLIILGVASGALMSSLSGFGAGTPAYHSCIACGIAAVLGAAMNIPIAAIIITIRMFGAYYALPAIIGGILAFFVFKSKTIYEYSTAASTSGDRRRDPHTP
jgi:CIC family chloride channel protein